MQMTKALGACALMPFADGLHDLQVDADQVVAAHAGLARHAGGDDADVGTRDVGVVVRALQRDVRAEHGGGLGDVQRLALRRALGDVEQDDVAQRLARRDVGQGATDHSGADEGDLRASHKHSFLAHRAVARPEAGWAGEGKAWRRSRPGRAGLQGFGTGIKTEFSMRPVLAALSLALIAAPAVAQTPPATIGQQYVPAPWWMRDPVIASIGYVRVELQANRAGLSATFQVVDRSVAEASRKAADQVRALSQTLAAYGVDTVRVETSLTTQPLYDQYRDEQGVLRDNTRADRIERYQTQARVSLTIRDVAQLERIYATVVASQPASISPVYFTLEPDNLAKSNLAAAAMRDARNRAMAATQNAGATLGAVRVIDPTGRACQTDVLAGWPSYGSGGGQATTVDSDDIVVTGSRIAEMAAPPPPPPAPPPPPPAPGMPGAGVSEAQIEAARLALQPPLQVLTDQACVVYGLN